MVADDADWNYVGYPKPWRVVFNGAVATVIAENGHAVPWTLVEMALNESSVAGARDGD